MPDSTTVAGPGDLVLWGDTRSIRVQTAGGAVEITRRRTEVALSGGSLQPVSIEGVEPAAEVEVLEALQSGEALLVDMRTAEGWEQCSIPGAVHLPYREVAGRLDELGCTGSAERGWNCSGARDVIAFCNGPACGQTPAGIRAMIAAGYPPARIRYYRGGVQDWLVLGLTIAVPGRPRSAGAP